MKKLSKKNKIGKYQNAWGPLGLNVGPVSLSTGVSLPEVVGGASILPVATAVSFPIGEIMNYKLHQNGGGVTTSPYTTTSVYTPELSDATYVTIPTLSEPRYYSPWGFDIHIGTSKARRDSTTTATPAPGQPEDPKDWKDLSTARKWAKILGPVGKGLGFAARHALDPEAVLLYLLGGTGYGIYKHNENKKEEKEKEKKEELEKRRQKMLGN